MFHVLLLFISRSFKNEHIRQINGSYDNESLDPHSASEVPTAKQVITIPSDNMFTALAEEGINTGVKTESNSSNLERIEEERNEQPLDGGEASMTQNLTVPPVFERLQSIGDDLRKTPGFQFLTRSDLYQYAVVGCLFEEQNRPIFSMDFESWIGV